MKKITLLKTMLLAVILLVGSGSILAEYEGTGIFNKITSLEEFTDGYYVVAYGETKAMSNTYSSNVLQPANINVISNSIENPSKSIVWKIETVSDGKYSIYNEETAKYTSYTGSSNNIQVVDNATANNQYWTLAYTSNLFRIRNAAVTSRYIQYNTSSPRFACYNGSQQYLTLYKLLQSSVATPTFSIAEGTYYSAQSVELATETEEALIYYTTDDSEPTNESTLYNGAIQVNATTTIKAIAYKEGESSKVATATYTIDLSPQITVSSISDVMSAVAGTTATQTFTISGFNLTQNIEILIVDEDEYFSVSDEELIPQEGILAETPITISYTPQTAGTHEAMFEIVGVTDIIDIITGTATLATAVATEATVVSNNSFTANWDAVAGASEYELAVYTKAEGSPENLIGNGDFEVGNLNDWIFESSMNQVVSTENQYSGSSSLYLSVIATKKLQQIISLTQDVDYTLSFWYYLDETSNGNGFRVWTTNGATIQLPSTSTYYNTKGSWEKVEVDFTAEANSMTFEMRFYNGCKVFLDDISVTEIGASSIVKSPIPGSPFTANGTSQEISGLEAATDYYYTVKAKAGTYESAESNEISVKTTGTSVGMEDISLSHLYAANGQIHFNATAGENIEIYDSMGKRIYQGFATEGLNSIAVDAGIVMVKVGNEVNKVIVR